MWRKEQPYLCADCPALAQEARVRVEAKLVTSDPREATSKANAEKTGDQRVRRRDKDNILSKVYIVFAQVTHSGNPFIPVETTLRMPVKSLRRSRDRFQNSVFNRIKQCKGPKKGFERDICPAVKIVAPLKKPL